MHALLGGLDPEYEQMTIQSLETIRDNLLYRPMTSTNENILLAGNCISQKNRIELVAEMQHLTCFAGGMYGLAGRLFSRDDFVDLGSRLTAGCVWAYDSFETKIMPEISQLIACESMTGPCPDTNHQLPHDRENQLPDGFVKVRDKRYQLRPEAIESVFYMWRITGEQVWRDAAWRMWQGIIKETETETAFASISDVTKHASSRIDSMEVSDPYSAVKKDLELMTCVTDILAIRDAQVLLFDIRRRQRHQLGRVGAQHGGASIPPPLSWAHICYG